MALGLMPWIKTPPDVWQKGRGYLPALFPQIFSPEGRIIGRHALFRQMANFGCVIIRFEQV